MNNKSKTLSELENIIEVHHTKDIKKSDYDGFLIQTIIQKKYWYNCQSKIYDKLFKFKLKFTEFKEISIEEIDSEYNDLLEGQLWILKLEAISLNKAPVDGCKVRQLLQLQDSEEFIFEPFTGGKLDTDKKSGLHRFSGWSNNPPLSPELKARGSVIFVLPEEEEQYSISIKNGSLTKI